MTSSVELVLSLFLHVSSFSPLLSLSQFSLYPHSSISLPICLRSTPSSLQFTMNLPLYCRLKLLSDLLESCADSQFCISSLASWHGTHITSSQSLPVVSISDPLSGKSMPILLEETTFLWSPFISSFLRLHRSVHIWPVRALNSPGCSDWIINEHYDPRQANDINARTFYAELWCWWNKFRPVWDHICYHLGVDCLRNNSTQ